WLSCWSVLSQTFRKCFHALQATKPKILLLDRNPSRSRFKKGSALAHLERHWTDVQPAECGDIIQAFQCSDPEAEATLAANEILRFVRDGGGRFRDVA